MFLTHGVEHLVNDKWTVGVALTCFALIAATVGVKTGNRAYANNMFRLRGMKRWHRNYDGSFDSYTQLFFSAVAAQGFTVLAMVGGSLYYTYKEQQLKDAAKKESSS